MISMRYHIVSLAAVFLAFALGVVFGATKISSPILAGLQDDKASLSSQTDDLNRPTRTSPVGSPRMRNSPAPSHNSPSAAPCRAAMSC